MMDFRIFLGFSERDFGSCGRQRNVCFQEFACCRDEFVLFSFDSGLFKLRRIWLWRGEVVELRNFSFRSDRCCQDYFRMDQQHWRISFSLFEEQTKSLSWGVDSLEKEGTRLLFNFPAIQNSFLSIAADC